ncbi:PREDICTED: uncharacterized protein LOC108663620 [Theobroma cacao]|uniref:Uncharacterized protein LOC108663620 n=1 Tax=Theobroma cacao TaxID=3641 RepID=A0AB32X2H7_THECC|nr:PREDICTED: uncharacterized protein LOC108663620 [Theobroma cacao]
MGYKLDGETFVKTPKVALRKKASLPAHPEVSLSQFSNEMLFNLLMRINGKLTNQAVRMEKIEGKMAESEKMLEEKGKMPIEPTAVDSSVTPSLAPVRQGAEGSVFQAEGHEPEKVESEQGTEVLGSLDENPPFPPKPQKEQLSPPNSEEVSIMDVFHQMVKEEQAEKEAAEAQAQKFAFIEPTPTSEKLSGKGKEKAPAASQAQSKPLGKGMTTMATKTKFLKRRKYSRIPEKAKPSVIFSPQEPLEIPNKSSLEPSPQK